MGPKHDVNALLAGLNFKAMISWLHLPDMGSKCMATHWWTLFSLGITVLYFGVPLCGAKSRRQGYVKLAGVL